MKNVRDFIPPGADVQMLSDAVRSVVATGGALFFDPSIDYPILSSLQPPPGTLLMSSGARIMCPDAGWLMDNSDHFGIVNVKNADGVRITGLRLHGSKVADQAHAVKLVYVENVNGFSLDHCSLEHSAWEGVWQGGTRQTNRGLRIESNDIEDVGFPNSYAGLPAIQLNAQESVVANNRLYNVGSGIGVCGSRNTITGNVVKECTLAGISTGDGGENGANAITGNVIEFGYVAGAVQVGILVGGGSPLYATNVTGNVVRLRGAPSTNARCYRHSGAASSLFTGNLAEIDVQGIGFEAYGSGAGETVSFVGNAVRVTNENTTSYGFSGVPNGAGKLLTLVSSGNRVTGISRARGSFAYDYNANGGGTLTALMMNDVQSEGALRIGGAYYGAGQYDFVPINLSVLNYVHP